MTTVRTGRLPPTSPAVDASPSPASLLFLRALINRRASIDIPAERRSLWVSRLSPVLKTSGLRDIEALVSTLQSGDRALEQAVVDAMTTNETMFFRDGPVFESIVTHLVPRLLSQLDPASRLTIWSGACSSGQEVYSLAMLIDLHHPELIRSGRLRILASDLSRTMVERSRAGSYSTLEARRGLTERHLRSYFEREGDQWVVGPRLRRIVLCRQLNLMEPLDPIPRCELVLLRNVLIYFSPEDRLHILRNIRNHVLRPEGALVLGASEPIGSAEHDYRSEPLPNGYYFTPRP